MYSGFNVLREAKGVDDERLYPKGYISTNDDLSLLLAFRFSGELVLWAALNIDVGSSLNLLNAILESVSSTFNFKLDINDKPLVTEDLTLVNNILEDGSGFSTGGDFYYERSHGL